MSAKNLPIKVVLQKATDTLRNQGGGGIKFFSQVTPELQSSVAGMFKEVGTHYDDVFTDNALIPAVGKITVVADAIAKSHKPNDLCRLCPIIGSEDLNEIYIKVSKQAIEDTVALIMNPPSKRFLANLSAIESVKPITTEEKISKSLEQISAQGNFDTIRNNIKVKLFDFGDDFDNAQIMGYVKDKFTELGFEGKFRTISYGDKIKLIKVEVSSYKDIVSLASVNGVKSVGFFQEYSLPLDEFGDDGLEDFLNDEYSDSELRIGIIDGGISDDNALLQPFIVAREEYVSAVYRNPNHATFIASTIQYGNKLNGIKARGAKRFRFVDIIAIPNGDKKYGPVDFIGEEELMEIIEEVMEKYSSSTKIWNISLGIESMLCDDIMSDLGIFLDYIQDTYQVQIFVSSGNLNQPPYREWPVQKNMGERDRIISPADSIRSITVGSLALYDSNEAIVKKNNPSPFVTTQVL